MADFFGSLSKVIHTSIILAVILFFYSMPLVIDYSDYVRDMYKLKLNDITIK